MDVDADGWAESDGDCDDSNGWVNPGLPEICDGIDNNCDGFVDEECDETTIIAPTGGCGCGVPGASTAPVWPVWVLFALWGTRRRTHAHQEMSRIGQEIV